MNISTNKLSHIIFIFITLASLTIMISCSSEEEFVVPKEENEQTVIMFFPWSSNLLPYFQQNIKDFSKRFLRHSQIFEQLFVLINTKVAF